ncbi:hypothetical protein Tco_1238276 [Tanacetum coccineum]
MENGFTSLHHDDANDLQRMPSSEEIRSAVWACGSDKSSGPDGFSFLFLKKYWDYFKGDVEKLVLDFMETDSLPRGLKINIAKSNVYGVGVSEENLEAMATLTRCLAGSLPFTYLGLPIGKNMKLTDSWCVMVDKFKSKLSNWKANLLSISGRLTLIKSVLGSFEVALETSEQTGLTLVRIIKAFHGMEAGLDEKDTWSWNWGRPITSGRTSNLLHILMHELRDVALSANPYSWTWSIGVHGVFSVADTRLHIDHSILSSSTIITRWNKGLPRKCPICNANVESNDHNFFSCEVASSVWDLIRLWCNISCPLPSSSHDWIVWIDNWPGSSLQKDRLYVVIASMFWNL